MIIQSPSSPVGVQRTTPALIQFHHHTSSPHTITTTYTITITTSTTLLPLTTSTTISYITSSIISTTFQLLTTREGWREEKASGQRSARKTEDQYPACLCLCFVLQPSEARWRD